MLRSDLFANCGFRIPKWVTGLNPAGFRRLMIIIQLNWPKINVQMRFANEFV